MSKLYGIACLGFIVVVYVGCSSNSGGLHAGDGSVDTRRDGATNTTTSTNTSTSTSTSTSTAISSCEQGGGSCVAVVPGSCSGRIDTTRSCGTGVGVECCMPGSGAGGAGGKLGSGGISGSGGAAGTGGKQGSGGSVSSGGTSGSGGIPGTGGKLGSGGIVSSGGTSGSGGISGSGGSVGQSCAQAGGECVAVVPGSCSSGTIDPRYSCGGIGSVCCFTSGIDGGSGNKDANGCKTVVCPNICLCGYQQDANGCQTCTCLPIGAGPC